MFKYFINSHECCLSSNVMPEPGEGSARPLSACLSVCPAPCAGPGELGGAGLGSPSRRARPAYFEHNAL